MTHPTNDRYQGLLDPEVARQNSASDLRMDGRENVRIVLGERNIQLRAVLRDALRESGFTQLLEVAALADLERAVEEEGVDLLISNCDLPGGDICDLLYRLRHHQAGKNPFLLTVLTMASPNGEMVKKVVDAGSDDLIVMPASVETFIERIMRVIMQRRPFVVTSDYIGPDRRHQSRPGASTTQLLDVPNPAKLKANNFYSQQRVQEVLDKAAAGLNEFKLERHATQVTWLVEKLYAHFEEGEGGGDLDAHIRRLEYVAEDMARRLTGSRFDHVSDICGSLLGVARHMKKNLTLVGGPKLDEKDLRLLPELAQAIELAFSVDDEDAKLAGDISGVIDSFVAK